MQFGRMARHCKGGEEVGGGSSGLDVSHRSYFFLQNVDLKW